MHCTVSPHCMSQSPQLVRVFIGNYSYNFIYNLFCFILFHIVFKFWHPTFLLTTCKYQVRKYSFVLMITSNSTTAFLAWLSKAFNSILKALYVILTCVWCCVWTKYLIQFLLKLWSGRVIFRVPRIRSETAQLARSFHCARYH